MIQLNVFELNKIKKICEEVGTEYLHWHRQILLVLAVFLHLPTRQKSQITLLEYLLRYQGWRIGNCGVTTTPR